ncbi:MAG: BatA domain-containing protein [candidate division WOR-3 bacterium]
MKFLNPNYLWGLVLVLAPIIIHLIFKKNLKRIPFSSLWLLKSADINRLKWLRLKELIILIARSVLVAGIFLALARPQYEGGSFPSNKLAAVYLVVDNSLSMHYGDNFENALKQAKRWIKNYSSKSLFYVTPLCPDEGNNFFWMNQQTALKRLEDIKLSFKTGFLKIHYKDFLNKPAPFPKEFIYIGDGQQINFKDLTSLKDFYWLPVPLGSNVAIEQVRVKEYPGGSEGIYPLEVKVKNYGNKIFSGKLELITDNFSRQQELTIADNGMGTVLFFLPKDIRKGIIRISPDSLLSDNEYYFFKALPAKIKVLIAGETKYLKTALAPSVQVPLLFQVDSTSNLKNFNPREYQVVILNGIAEISEFELLKLRNFASQPGTGLVIFLGPIIGARLKELILPVGELESWLTLDGYLNIDWLDEGYPPFLPLTHNQGIKGIKIFRLWEMKPHGRCLMRLNNRLPFLVHWNNMMVFATMPEKENTDIMYNPNFVPILYTSIYGLTHREIDKEYRLSEITGEADFKNPIERPGFYKIGTDTFGINPDLVESNPAVITPRMASEMGIKVVNPDIVAGTVDFTNQFLFISLCAFMVEVILLFL